MQASAGPPQVEGLVASAACWSELTGQGERWELEPERLVRRRPPIADKGSLRLLAPYLSYVAPAAVVTALPRAVAVGSEGTVVTADGCLLADLARRSRDAIEDHVLWGSGPLTTDIVDLPGTSALIASQGARDNFAHFLVDSLPRLMLVRQTGERIDRILVSGTAQRWQREGLAWLGVDPGLVLSLDEVPAVRAERLLVPTRTRHCPRTAPWARRLMPRRPKRRGRPLFLTRTSATRRRLTNEDRVADHLRRRGFDVVDPVRLCLLDQIDLVVNAPVVVLQHGAALGHLLLAAPGGGCVEMTNPLAVHPEGWGLSELAGRLHAYCSTPAVAPGLGPSDAEQLHLDVQARLDWLDTALDQVTAA